MKRIVAFLCVVALMLGVANPAVFAAETAAAATNGAENYSSLQAAVNDYTSGVIVMQANAQDLTVNRDVYLDLNGHTVENVTVTGGTLYCKDSETDDYTVADGVYGKLTGTITGNVAGVPEEAACAEHGYLKVTETDGISFHCVNLKIYAMSLRATEVGVYYKSYFAGDELVAQNVLNFGVALSVVAEPNATNLNAYCGYSIFSNFLAGNGANSAKATGTLLRDIMKAGNKDRINARNAAMPVYGRAYIKTADGYMFGATVNRNLKQQVEAIDTMWDKLLVTQKAPVSAMYENFANVMGSWNIPNIQAGEPGSGDDEIIVPIPVSVENGVVTKDAVVSRSGISVTVPAGTKLATGATGLKLAVTPKENSDAGLTLEESQVLMPIDVHVDGISADNTAPLTIYLGKVMPENLNMGNYTVYHVENGKANEMTLIAADAEFTAHNQYKYTLDGELIFYMASFSETAVVYNEDNSWKGNRDYSWYDAEKTELEIRNADQLAGFGAIVGGMDGQTEDTFAGKTVKLLADISIGDLDSENGITFYPIGYWNSTESYEKQSGISVSSYYKHFGGTFDGNGNTISDFYQNTWEMFADYNDGYEGTPNHSRDGMGLFGNVYGGTVKNLTVENFSSDGEFASTGVIAAYADSGNGKSATFENITIFNCNPRVYNIGNGGIVGCAGWYSRSDETAEGFPVIFKNITVDQTNKISALWGSWDVSCGGILGQYYPDSGCGLVFKNCHVAAEIDVNNDVCANYQYYWYRYSGMLMGTVRSNTTDVNGYTVANIDGIEVSGCTYTIGDWSEYWYCELVKNSLASYTHDHQFSRLTKIKNLSEIWDGEKWIKEGNFVIPEEDNSSATCYHIFKDSNGDLYQHHHDQGDETNNNEPYETVNGQKMLKEDRTCYFMPFNQVLSGLGYGVKPTYELDGFEEIPNGTVKAVEKFEAKADRPTTVYSGQTITLGELFKSAVDDSVLSKTTIYAAVSPADDESNVSATYTLDMANWENSKITFADDCEGVAKIVITDYIYCKRTKVYVTVKDAGEKDEVVQEDTDIVVPFPFIKNAG